MRTLLCAIGVLTLGAACGGDGGRSMAADSYRTFSLAQSADSIPVRMGETVRVESILLTLTDLIADSRCPAQAYCVHPGDAEVGIRANAACQPNCEVAQATGRLHTMESPRALVYRGRRISLAWLLPLPVTPNTLPNPAEYVAWFKVVPE